MTQVSMNEPTRLNPEIFRDCDFFEIPEYAIPYLVNSDPSGLSKKDIRTIDKWVRDMNRAGLNPCGFTCVKDIDGEMFIDYEAEPYFSWRPAFGEACNVYFCALEKRRA